MKRILVVEDNKVNQDLILRRLKKKGFEVILAEDGEQALQMAVEERPDIILLDMELPKKDGWTVVSDLRQDQKIMLIPVIALTAHAMQGDRDKALQAGCDEFEAKPVDINSLVQKIEKLTAD